MEFPVNIFRPTVQPRRWIIAIVALAALLVAVYIAVFFYEVNSTLSDATWGDVSFYNQLAYNFTHGRPLQSSLYDYGGPGVLANPFPYVHSFSCRVNLTPYLFIWIHKFMPTVNGLYLATIFFNMAGLLIVGWLIASRIFSDKDKFILYSFACALFFCAPLIMGVITYKGHFQLFAGPIILAAYYFCLTGNKPMFLVTGLLLCGISEDMTAFMISFSAYLFIFERHMRRIALWMGVISVVYLATAFLVIQPAARCELTVAYNYDARLSTVFSDVLKPLGFEAIKKFLIGLFTALSVMLLFLGFKKAPEWKKVLGMIFLAPASHYFIVLVLGPGHHFVPVLSCVFLAFLLIVSRMELRPISLARLSAAVLIFAALFLSDIYRMAKNSPFFGDVTSAVRMETNKSVLMDIDALPKEAGISYWTNQGVDAFISSRNSAWRFPGHFDSADYLVIQKDADRTFFYMEVKASEGIENAIKNGQFYSSGAQVAIPAETVRAIKRRLVSEKASHDIIVDDEHSLILKRKVSAAMPCPESTLGLNWLKHIDFLKKWRKP